MIDQGLRNLFLSEYWDLHEECDSLGGVQVHISKVKEKNSSRGCWPLKGAASAQNLQGSETNTRVICLSVKSQINVSGLFCSLPKHSLPYWQSSQFFLPQDAVEERRKAEEAAKREEEVAAKKAAAAAEKSAKKQQQQQNKKKAGTPNKVEFWVKLFDYLII